MSVCLQETLSSSPYPVILRLVILDVVHSRHVDNHLASSRGSSSHEEELEKEDWPVKIYCWPGEWAEEDEEHLSCPTTDFINCFSGETHEMDHKTCTDEVAPF